MKLQFTLKRLLLALLLLFDAGCGPSVRFPSGKDTAQSIGDGRYQILRQPRPRQRYTLRDEQLQHTIADAIRDWTVSSGVVYMRTDSDDETYLVFDTVSSVRSAYRDLETASEQQREKLRMLK